MKRGAASLALSLAVLLAAWRQPLAADTYPRQPGIDAIHYVFRLTLGDDSDEIRGETTARIRFLQDGVHEIALDLASPSGGRGMTVSTVTTDAERPLAFHQGADRLRIVLPEPSVAGRELTVTIHYAGIPASGLRIGPNRYGERTFFGESWPDKARQWLPVVDHPSDKAAGEMIVTAPAHYQVVANGLLTETTDLPGGLRRTHWRQSVPIASWLFTVAVAPFASHHADPAGGIDLQSWIFPQNRDEGVAAFEGPARQALEYYSERIGPYPFEKLANVQAAGFKGGVEHASAIFYSEDLIPGKPIAGIVAHEIAHQWFGDSVTESDWDDVWLSEGFATYFTLLFNEHREGHDAFLDGLRSSRERVLKAEAENPGTPVVHPNLADMTKVLNALVYQKGAWTLHMLRRRIGDEAFWRGIRDYYRRFRDRNATTADFRQVMEQASEQELGAFFHQWLERSGVPKLGGSWRWDAAGKKVVVRLEQLQAGEPFRLPVEISLGSIPPAPPRIETVELAGRSATFTFVADTEPKAVVLDPESWLLLEAAPFTKAE